MQQHNHQEGKFCLKQTFIIENNAHFYAKFLDKRIQEKLKKRFRGKKNQT
jgi:hypothetical protein